MDREHRPIDLGEHAGEAPAVAEMVATYTITINCENCDYEGEAQIPKGTKVADGECPPCGCQTVVKAKSKQIEQQRGEDRQISDLQRAIQESQRRPPNGPARSPSSYPDNNRYRVSPSGVFGGAGIGNMVSNQQAR